MLGGFLVLTLVGTSVNDFTDQLPFYEEKLRAQTLILFEWLEDMGIKLSRQVLMDHFNPGALMQSAASMLAKAGGVLTNSFMILLTVIFILLEAAGMPSKVRAALGDADSSLESFEKFVTSVRQYLVIKTIVSAVTGIIIAVGLLLLGLDYALLWGMIAFLLNYVPNIGSIIAAVPAILLAIVQIGPGYSLIVGLIYLITNIVMGNAVEPRMMGQNSASRLWLSFCPWSFGAGFSVRSACCCQSP